MDKKSSRAKAGPITGAYIVTMPTPTGTTPAMICNGDVPEKGDVLQFECPTASLIPAQWPTLPKPAAKRWSSSPMG